MKMMNHPWRFGLGVLFWVAVVAAGYAAKASARRGQSGDPAVTLVDYFAGPVVRVNAVDPSARLRVHDPIFYQEDTGAWSQIGYVQAAAGGPEAGVTLSWHDRRIVPSQCQLWQYHSSGRLEEVVATMLPPEKRLAIQQRLAAALNAHGDELSTAFVPLVEESLRQSIPVIDDEFRAAVDRHRSEIDQLGRRWNDEVVNQRLLPLARREIIPIVRTHGEPAAEQIGRELWDRASLWRFGWRAAYDKSPLPRRDLLQQEWDRFVEQEAMPVFEQHMDEIVEAVQRILSDVAASEAVRRELAEVADDVARDPETRRMVRTILVETLVDNPRLRQVWSGVWTSDEAQRALELAGDRLEPVVRQIGDDLFGSERQGIDPNFARVLRNQILGKDRRWIVARRTGQPSAGAVATILLASESMPYPIVYLADRQPVTGTSP